MEQQTVSDADLFEPSDFSDQEYEENESNDSSAVEETNEEQTASQEQYDAETEVSYDKQETQTGDVIDEFLAKKGIDPSKPEDVRKLANMYANAEKGFYLKSQEKAKLERELANRQPITTSDPSGQALQEVRSLKTQMNVEKWKAEKQISPESEQKMMDWFSQPVTNSDGQPLLDLNGKPIIRGYLYTNGLISLDDVYAIVGGGKNPDLDEKRQNLTEELRNEVKREMSARQTAKRPAGGTTNSTQFDKPKEHDFFLEGLEL